MWTLLFGDKALFHLTSSVHCRLYKHSLWYLTAVGMSGSSTGYQTTGFHLIPDASKETSRQKGKMRIGRWTNWPNKSTLFPKLVQYLQWGQANKHALWGFRDEKGHTWLHLVNWSECSLGLSGQWLLLGSLVWPKLYGANWCREWFNYWCGILAHAFEILGP